MDDDLKRKVSGRILEILQNMWKLECKKEEKKLLDKWKNLVFGLCEVIWK